MANNVIIPMKNAGIGDAILLQSGMDGSSLSHFKAVAASSVQATPPSGYLWYGIVYGREKNGLMIRSLSPSSQKWASVDVDIALTLDTAKHSNVINTTTTNWGYARNGLNSANYRCLSIAECISRCANNNNTNLHPNTSKYDTAIPPMGLANFNADTSGAKTLYGTYANYIAQTCPILKGNASGVFGFRCGKQNTKELALNASKEGYTFPAAQYCYNYKVGSELSNNWWLPDMYELYMMICDNSFANCVSTATILGGNVARNITRWSSVRYSASVAIDYNGAGFSAKAIFMNSLTAHPVTLIPLT